MLLQTQINHVGQVLQHCLDKQVSKKVEQCEVKVSTVFFKLHCLIFLTSNFQIDTAKVSAVSELPDPTNRKKAHYNVSWVLPTFTDASPGTLVLLLLLSMP